MLFADEISTGLDSATTHDIVQVGTQIHPRFILNSWAVRLSRVGCGEQAVHHGVAADACLLGCISALGPFAPILTPVLPPPTPPCRP